MEELAKEGILISQRSIQRDLKFLSQKYFPTLKGDGNLDAQGWFWDKDTQLLDIPAIDLVTALTFQLTEKFLSDKLPASVFESLRPYFNLARQRLNESGNNDQPDILDKIRIILRSLPLLPAGIDSLQLEKICDALQQQRKIRCRYTKKLGEIVGYDLNPLGLVCRDTVMYLIASAWEYEDILQFAIHRFVTCEIIDETANIPADFDIDAYINEGNFEYLVGEPLQIDIELLFYDQVGGHLQETPLSSNQIFTNEIQGRTRIRATVKNSSQLRWWLLGFGEYVEVIKPVFLREEFSLISGKMSQRYSMESIE
jgi:predicted DNA-binding transcriptional regulator YafY